MVLEGRVHRYEEQPEIGRIEYVARLEVPLMLQTELTDCVNTGRVDIGDNVGYIARDNPGPHPFEGVTRI